MIKPVKKESETLKNFTLFLGGLLLCIAVWEIIAYSTNQVFLPDFLLTLGRMFTLLGKKIAYVSLGYSLLRILISFVISGLLGVVLGLLGGYYPSLSKLLRPLVTVLRSIPTIAVVLLLAVYVKNFSLYVVGIVLFPVIYQATLEGSSTIYKTYEYELLLKGRKHWLSNIGRVILPLSMDYILLGLIQALGLGFKVEIMAETFAYSNTFKGLGKIIYTCYSNVEYEDMMAYVLIAVFTSLIFDGLLLLGRNYLEKKIGISKKENSTDLVIK